MEKKVLHALFVGVRIGATCLEQSLKIKVHKSSDPVNPLLQNYPIRTRVHKDLCERHFLQHYLESKSLKKPKCLSREGMNVKHGYYVN